MLFMAQGVPMLFSGDEFGNSQSGNNNPYCQDNETGWIDWRALDKNTEILDYVKFLVKVRFDNIILHNAKPFKLMDYISCGYPDLSCHGREAWRPDLTGHSHILGMLYCGKYDKAVKDSPFIYVCYNMHWTNEEMALPKLPDGLKWNLLSDTGLPVENKNEGAGAAMETLCERSVRIYISENDPEYKTKKETKRKRT